MHASGIPADPPRVDYFAFGGTIASLATEEGAGVVPVLTAEQILAAVPQVQEVADVRTHQVAQVGSGELTIPVLRRLVTEARRAVDEGSRGVVVTQGTDTIEETAFVLDLLWDSDVPVVFTGAMRHPRMPGSDANANLLAAMTVAADPAAAGLGVLVVLKDEIHAARLVRKVHTSSVDAFSSRPHGPLGLLSENRPVVALRPASRPTVAIPPDADQPVVALVRVGLGDDLRLLKAARRLGYAGVVIEALGGGHVPAAALEVVAEVARELPVVLASRAYSGEVLTSTYLFPGCEGQLLQLGLIRAGGLGGVKARMLLAVCLAARMEQAAIGETFARVALTTGPVMSQGGPNVD